MYLVNNKLWVKLNTFSWIKLFNSLIPLSYQINDTRRSIRMIKNNWNWVEFHIRYNFNSASRKRSVLHGDRLDRCREVSFHFSRFAQARATERVRPRRHWPSFAIRMIRKLSSQHLTVLTGDERWKMGDERALVPPTRQRKREERRARVLSIRTARLATLSALTWTTLSVVATTGTLVTVTRDGTVTDIVVAIHASGCLAPLSLLFFFFFSSERCHDATTTVVTAHREHDTRLGSSSLCGKSSSSSSSSSQIRNTYYTGLSKESEHARSLARAQ